MYRKILRMKEAVEIAGLSRRQLARLARMGKIPAYKVGSHTSPWLFPKGLFFNTLVSRFHERGRRRLRNLVRKIHSRCLSCLKPDVMEPITTSDKVTG